MLLLIATQTIRTEHSQQKLQAQLDKIQRNTEQPPQVTVNVPQSAPPKIVVNPPHQPTRGGFIQFGRMPEFLNNGQIAAGVPITVNLFLTNKGSEPVDNFYRYLGIALAPITESNSDQVDGEIHSNFQRNALKAQRELAKSGNKGLTINVGETAWNTLNTPPLTKEQVDDIMRGKLRFYVYGWARWKDELHDLDSCTWLQAPSTTQIDSNKAVWHVCAN